MKREKTQVKVKNGLRSAERKSHRDALFRTPHRKILVCVTLANIGIRNFFSGILKYADEHTNWDIRVPHEPGDLTASQLEEACRN